MKSGPEFSGYIGIPYKFKNSPGAVSSDAIEMNCIRLIHRVYKEQFGAVLPIGMWARETLADEDVVFETVRDGSVKIGDVFVFGREIPGESPVFHLALYTGQRDANGDSLLLHTTHLNGRRSGIWPFSKFGEFQRYEKLHAVKRLNPGHFRAHIAPLI